MELTVTKTVTRALLRLIVVSTVTALCSGTAAAGSADPGRHCLRQWPNDRDSFLLCQQLQNRNHLSFRHFLSEHGLSKKQLEQGETNGNPVAEAAAYCLQHRAPDYQGVWQCTQRRTAAGR